MAALAALSQFGSDMDNFHASSVPCDDLTDAQIESERLRMARLIEQTALEFNDFHVHLTDGIRKCVIARLRGQVLTPKETIDVQSAVESLQAIDTSRMLFDLYKQVVQDVGSTLKIHQEVCDFAQWLSSMLMVADRLTKGGSDVVLDQLEQDTDDESSVVDDIILVAEDYMERHCSKH